MSDETVHAALRSDAPLVVVEAPAGCGKTHQGAEYARTWHAPGAHADRLSSRTRMPHVRSSRNALGNAGNRVDIRTIDSVIARYRRRLSRWPGAAAGHCQRGSASRMKDTRELALKIAVLVKRHPMIPQALARRHPVVICDEHQDSSGDQHTLAMALFIRARVCASLRTRCRRSSGRTSRGIALL